ARSVLAADVDGDEVEVVAEDEDAESESDSDEDSDAEVAGADALTEEDAAADKKTSVVEGSLACFGCFCQKQFRWQHLGAIAMAAAQKEIIHELVERSRGRLVQVRAGSSLRRVLQQEGEGTASSPSPSTKATVCANALPHLRPSLSLVLSTTHDTRKAANPTLEDGRDSRRPRGMTRRLPESASAGHLPEVTTSYQQYQRFMDDKAHRSEMLHQHQRRVAVVPCAAELKKLATVCAAALAEMEDAPDTSTSPAEPLHAKLLHAMALLRGGHAFVDAKALAPPPAPAFAQMKNTHLAFLEFKRDSAGDAKRHRVHPSVGLQQGNTSSKTPIHFGDQICFLSAVSNLPLAIGPDGRSYAARDASTGPHMTFTIVSHITCRLFTQRHIGSLAYQLLPPSCPSQVDFRNPSRNGEVTAADDFWLRVDPATLAQPRRIHLSRMDVHINEGEGPDHEGGGDAGDDLDSLLSDTSYYLGCPGWLDDGGVDVSASTPQKEVVTATQTAARAQKKALAKGRGEQRTRRFRLVAMKAVTPSRAYYGDDEATREYAMETNESVMRLARWRFVRYEQQAGEDVRKACGDEEQDVNDAMVSCTTVYLTLQDVTLAFDEELHRGVGLRMASNTSAASTESLELHCRKPRSSHRTGVESLGRLSHCARWQVRLLNRSHGVSRLQELDLAMAAVGGAAGREDNSRVEWLRKRQAKVAVNDQRLGEKQALALEARRQYDLVAVRSNEKLKQIERQKAAHAPEYFQQRLQMLKAAGNSHKPHELKQLKQQELQRVVELPRL
ncbi:hypothetical protein BBJ28_00010137, partial [Nothophytophthora sp. Chile5]